MVNNEEVSIRESRRSTEAYENFFSKTDNEDDEKWCSSDSGENDFDENYSAERTGQVESEDGEDEMGIEDFLSDESDWEVSDFRSSSESDEEWKP